MSNQYAVYQDQNENIFSNPVYWSIPAVGESIDGYKVVAVGDLEKCEAIVEANKKPARNLFDLL